MTDYNVMRAEVNLHSGTVELPEDARIVGLEHKKRAGWDTEHIVYLTEAV